MERMSTDGSLIEQTATSVTAAIDAAPATKQSAEQETAANRERMKTLMVGMEVARETKGNFFVSFGEPNTPNHILMFAMPAQEPYSEEYMKKGWTHGPISSTFVIATENGFYGYDFNLKRMRGTSTNMTPQQEAASLRAVIESAAKGFTQVDSNRAAFGGLGLEINNGTKDKIRMVFEPAKKETVDRAVAASLLYAKALHQPQLDRAQETGQTATSVQDQIGMTKTELLTPKPSPKSWKFWKS